MPILQYETRVSPDGTITVPPEFYGHKVVVSMDKRTDVNDDQSFDDDWQPDPTRILPNGKTPVEGFLDLCKERNLPSLTDEEERRRRIAAEQTRIADQTPEEWQAAVEDFMTAWRGCLKGVPHMTAKEIRAERLEKKYGQRGDEK